MGLSGVALIFLLIFTRLILAVTVGGPLGYAIFGVIAIIAYLVFEWLEDKFR
jgi:hypothetical protein